MVRISILVACTFLAIAHGFQIEDHRIHIPHKPHRPHWPHHPCHKTTTSAPTTAVPTSRPPHCPPWPLPCRGTTTPASSTSQLTDSTTSENLPTSSPIDTSIEWVLRDAGTLPLGCNFIYGGTANNRLLYVGRVNVSDELVPAAIHHYSTAGNEYYTAIGNEEVIVGRENVEWLCSAYGVAWVRVKDFSDEVLRSFNPVVIGRNSVTGAPTYACLSHSFYNNLYPPSVGQVVGNSCQFVVDNEIVDTNNFKWWHTLELLVSLNKK